MQSFFPTFIDQSKNLITPRFNAELLREIQQIRKIDFEGHKWSEKNYHAGFTSYGSMDQLHLSSPNFAQLEKAIAKKIINFIRVSEWDLSIKDLKMNSCWVNIMPKGAHHSFHLHPHSVLSGTYYVQVPLGASPLKFEDPRMSQMMLAPLKKTNCKTANKNFVSISSRARDLILFESWLRHEVTTNLSRGERISISFNYGYK